MEVAHKRKMTKYDPLRMDIERKGWRCKVLPIEMGCREYASIALIAYPCEIGLSDSELKRTTKKWKLRQSQLRAGFGRHHAHATKAQSGWPLQLLVAPVSDHLLW